MLRYIYPLIQWWWLILLAVILASVSSYITVSRQAPVYEVTTTLIIGRSLADPNPNSSELYLEGELAELYSNLGRREQVAFAVKKALGLNSLPEYTIRPVSNTPLIEIIVSSTDPVRAVAVANELANQLIQSSPSGKDQQDNDRQSFINDQLKKIQEQIKTTEKDITDAQRKLGDLTSVQQIAETQSQIASLGQKLLSLQNNYSSLLSNSRSGAINNLTVVQSAELPSSPIGSNLFVYIALAAVFGLVLSSAAAYGLDFIDNSFKTSEEVSELLNLPILGLIPTLTPSSNPWTYTIHFPRSPATDAFRNLRTNLEFKAVNEPLHTVLISGPDLGMGKSVIASNLAFMISQGEKKVILVDADLRRSNLNTALEITQKTGVTDICLGRASLSESLIPWQNNKNNNEPADDPSNLKSQGKPMLGVKASDFLFNFLQVGTLPPNPAELLASTKFDQLLKDMVNSCDIVIIDSPPLFLSDTSILLGKVDGVILVIELGRSSKKSVNMAIEKIHRSGANLLGVVLNRVRTGDPNYSNYQHY